MLMFEGNKSLGNIGSFFLKKGPMFPAFPKKGPMFPDMYVTGEHRTLFQKKGSMFPGLLLFPSLLPNSGRDNYHCMSLPSVEEGGAQSFWPGYYYTIILYYILSYKELQESQ